MKTTSICPSDTFPFSLFNDEDAHLLLNKELFCLVSINWIKPESGCFVVISNESYSSIVHIK